MKTFALAFDCLLFSENAKYYEDAFIILIGKMPFLRCEHIVVHYTKVELTQNWPWILSLFPWGISLPTMHCKIRGSRKKINDLSQKTRKTPFAKMKGAFTLLCAKKKRINCVMSRKTSADTLIPPNDYVQYVYWQLMDKQAAIYFH